MKRIMLLLVVLCSLAMAAGPAFAINVSLSPANQWLHPGETGSVDLVVSGVGGSGLASFYVDIYYNPLALAIDNADVVFGVLLGDPILFDADTFASVDQDHGKVHLDETSFLPDLSGQPDSFTLATLSFTFSGFSDLSLDLGQFGAGDGSQLDATAFNASVAPVPEPATMLLLGTGLAGLAGFRKRFFKKHA